MEAIAGAKAQNGTAEEGSVVYGKGARCKAQYFGAQSGIQIDGERKKRN